VENPFGDKQIHYDLDYNQNSLADLWYDVSDARVDVL
jgi:hypothetical protein